MSTAPRSIGPYQILAPLGAGGMAETYVALRRGPGGFEQRVCLKRIRQDIGGDAELVRQFMAEASIAANLRHAAIAQVLDFGHDGSDYYLALELVDGLDLHHLLHHLGAPMPHGLALYLAVELATALDVAHRSASSVVHRDVSPSNVLVSIEGEVKLTDFGIARALETPSHTRTGVVKGKVPYMAPEYARSGRFDVRCDLFGLGVLLYECLSGGARPYDGGTELETLERAGRGERASLASLAPNAPAPLADAIERLIEPEPELRFQSAAELLDALLAMEPAPGARRELGALVRRLRPQPAITPVAETVGYLEGAPTARADAGASAPAHPAAASAPTRTQTTQAGSAAPVTRGPLPWLALGASLVALAAVAFLALRSPGRAVPASSGGAEPAATGAAASPPANAPAPAADAPPVQTGEAPAGEASSEQGQAPAARTSVEVVVVPYGDVRVDGKHRGASPLKLTLPPGEHVIEARGPAVQERRTLTLHPGDHERVVFQ